MTKDELLAALTITVDRDGIDFDPSDEDAPYADWSSVLDQDAGRSFEFGQEGEAVVIGLRWDQIARLQQALTVLLLERP